MNQRVFDLNEHSAATVQDLANGMGLCCSEISWDDNDVTSESRVFCCGGPCYPGLERLYINTLGCKHYWTTVSSFTINLELLG